jgi:AcrR family transcriptional regulator
MAKQKEPEERRKEIIETAKQLFVKRGFKSTQVKDIVKEVGVAQGLFYYYFKSKEEVFQAVADDYAEAIVIKVKKLADSEKTETEKINLIFDIFLNEAENQKALFNEIQIAEDGLIHEKVLNQVGVKLIPLVAGFLKRGNCIGELECIYPEQMATVVVKGLISYLNQGKSTEKIDYFKDSIPFMKDVVTKAFGIKIT